MKWKLKIKIKIDKNKKMFFMLILLFKSKIKAFNKSLQQSVKNLELLKYLYYIFALNFYIIKYF